MKEIIEKLCNVDGISGYEMNASLVAKELIEPYVDEVYIDKFGSVIGRKNSKKADAKTIMLDAHVDQIGFIVTDIDDAGFLKFTSVGGVDPRMLLGLDVFVHGTEKIRGIISCLPPHLGTSANSVPSIEEMAIDVGFSKEQVQKIVKIGTPITFAEEVYSLSSDTVTGKCLDDRAGIASIIYAMQKLEKSELDVNVVTCFSTNEEIHSTGAITSTFNIRPDYAIAIDVTHGKTPDAPSGRTHPLGNLCIALGPNLHPKMSRDLIKTCKTYDIPYVIEVEEGHTGTNAWHIQVVRSGVPVSLISFPLKYMHTPIETVKISDIKNAGKLIAKYIKDYREDKND
ncbi:MAG: M42 family peptidase [Clostridia bacterium]